MRNISASPTYIECKEVDKDAGRQSFSCTAPKGPGGDTK